MLMSFPRILHRRPYYISQVASTRTAVIRLFALSIAFCTSFTFNPTSACAADASDIPPIRRTVLERRPIPGTDQSMELILVTFQPGVSAPLHHHPVAGLNYIVEGTAESAYGHVAPKLYREGDTLQDLPNVPHTVFRNPDKNKVLRFLIFTHLRAGQAYTVAP